MSTNVLRIGFCMYMRNVMNRVYNFLNIFQLQNWNAPKLVFEVLSRQWNIVFTGIRIV